MALQAVLFDLDDTLYDFMTPHRAALQAMAQYGAARFERPAQGFLEAYRREDRKIKQEQPTAAACHNRILIAQRMLESMGLPSLGEPLGLYEAYWGTILRQMTTRPGVIELLRELRERGLRIGICTDMTAHIQHRKLYALGLGTYIDCMVTSEESGADKPDAGMFLMCLEKLGVKPEEAVMIGDNFARDIVGAHRAGINGIWLNWKGEKEPPKADFAYREIHDWSALTL